MKPKPRLKSEAEYLCEGCPVCVLQPKSLHLETCANCWRCGFFRFMDCHEPWSVIGLAMLVALLTFGFILIMRSMQ